MPLDVTYPMTLLEDIFTDAQPVCVIVNDTTKDNDLKGIAKALKVMLTNKFKRPFELQPLTKTKKQYLVI